MAFGIGVKTQETELDQVRGRQMEIACKCWFNSKGGTIPLMIKFQDSMEEIHTITQIQVHFQEEKNYSGIPSVEYDVTVTYQGRKKRVKLIFFKEECRWIMNFM